MSVPEYRKGIGDDPGRRIDVQGGYVEYRYAPGQTCEIVNIEVGNAVRRTGVGRRLLQKLFEEVQGKASLVYAITSAVNEIAMDFYEGCGFRVVAVLRRFYDPHERGVDAIMYGRTPEGPV